MSAPAETALATLRTDATNAAERGRAAGSALAVRTARCLDAYLPLFADYGHDLDDVRRFGSRVLGRVQRWQPALATELEAFALGAQVEPELVAALNGRTELIALAECTVVGRCASAEGPWLAQNWDWYADALERCVIWSTAVEGARYATLTEAGMLAKVGVSTRGLAVALNILYCEADGRVDLGVPVHLVLRQLLAEAASVDDAEALLCDTPYSASSCVTVIDAAGGGACFELSPMGVARVEPSDGFLAHANNFLDDRLAAFERDPPGESVAGSRGRLAAAQLASPQTAAEGIEVLADHLCEPQPICRHDEPSGDANRPFVGTVVSLVMRPAVPELRVAAGQACESAFVSYAI